MAAIFLQVKLFRQLIPRLLGVDLGRFEILKFGSCFVGANLKSFRNHIQALACGLTPPRFSAHERCRINPQLLGHLSLREAERPSRRGKAFGETVANRQGVVSQEQNDGWHVANFGDGCVAFPKGNRRFVNANLVGDLLLEELEVQTPRANLIT